ncbi:1621_t:CDS:2 [Paraglomus occultum]|uniref:1621_t:CDS:1 n=1 Tax=Paraglomus occultum TaxID=144539 RepID=A0A9N8VJ04_9GLOM|nr:1621_t:CDS:2 [Paraglomus occultum]
MKFAKLTSVHVYSVGYSKPKVDSELAVVNHAIQKETTEPRNFNVIKNKNAVIADISRSAIVPPRKPELLMKVMTKETNLTVMTKETNLTVEIANKASTNKPQPMEQKLTKSRKTGTKVYRDARGFLVTEDVVEREARSEDKSAVRDVTSSKMNRACNSSENNATSPKSTKRKHNGSMGQKTLLSFFGKT